MDAVVWPIATMSNMAGVWTVTVVTLHRYIAVCLPHHAAKFANLTVARYQASRATLCYFTFGHWLTLCTLNIHLLTVKFSCSSSQN